MKFNWTTIFYPITWYRTNKGYKLNFVIIYIESLCWAIPLSIGIGKLLKIM